MSGIDQSTDHRTAHPSGADESDSHRGCSIRDSVASAASSTAPPATVAAVCDVGDQADVLLQQGAGHAGEPVQTSGVTAKYVEREAVSAAAGDHLGEALG